VIEQILNMEWENGNCWASKYIIWYFTWAWDHSEKSFWLVINKLIDEKIMCFTEFRFDDKYMIKISSVEKVIK